MESAKNSYRGEITLSFLYFKEREVWWCEMGLNVGFEQDGKGRRYERPVLVLKKFNKEICWVLPLSTKDKSGKYYCGVQLSDGIARIAILSQLRLIDTKRFNGKIGTIPKENFFDIKKAIMHLFQT